jgi:acetyltransferase
VAAARKARPDARVDGVTVQPMIRVNDGIELILGAKKDPTFGAVLLVGTGGIATEIFSDHALGLPPLNERLARRMLESLTAWPLLNGFRGRPPIHMDRLIEILIRFSYFVADFPEISEIDVNPLLVSAENAIALDARIVLDREALARPIAPYEHMVLRPYPDEYIRDVVLQDETPVTLRPIRPEDERLWIDLLRNCSPETIFSRFRAAVAWNRHDIATRYCFIDYDREIAIVAELQKDGKRQLVGVGRLIADPSHETVEYAVLVADEFQNRGLGGILTDFCSEIALRWKLKRIVAETDPTNTRMLALFQNRKFHVREGEEGVMEVEKTL